METLKVDPGECQACTRCYADKITSTHKFCHDIPALVYHEGYHVRATNASLTQQEYIFFPRLWSFPYLLHPADCRNAWLSFLEKRPSSRGTMPTTPSIGALCAPDWTWQASSIPYLDETWGWREMTAEAAYATPSRLRAQTTPPSAN